MLKRLLAIVAVLLPAPRTPSVHDYGPGTRKLGHDITFHPLAGGDLGIASGTGIGIEEGDYLLLEDLPSPDRRACYQVTKITYLRNSVDQWHAELARAPRPASA